MLIIIRSDLMIDPHYNSDTIPLLTKPVFNLGELLHQGLHKGRVARKEVRRPGEDTDGFLCIRGARGGGGR